MFPKLEHDPNPEKLHITILYIGNMILSSNQKKELNNLLYAAQLISEPLEITAIRAGKWSPVLFLELNDSKGSVQKQYRIFYNWCIRNGKVPEMHHGGDGTHPGPHITLGFPKTIEEAKNLEFQASGYLNSLTTTLPCWETLPTAGLVLEEKPVKFFNCLQNDEKSSTQVSPELPSSELFPSKDQAPPRMITSRIEVKRQGKMEEE